MSAEQINQRVNKILTRLNLSDKLSTLTVNQIKELKNPNKNSCVLTKLEILEKVLEKNSSKQNIKNYMFLKLFIRVEKTLFRFYLVSSIVNSKKLFYI